MQHATAHERPHLIHGAPCGHDLAFEGFRSPQPQGVDWDMLDTITQRSTSSRATTSRRPSPATELRSPATEIRSPIAESRSPRSEVRSPALEMASLAGEGGEHDGAAAAAEMVSHARPSS